MNDLTPTDAKANFSETWVEEVGHWWNFGHPWRGGPIWEDEVVMGTQGDAERGFLPDWEQWHLASSDRGVALMHRLWKEQVDRVREGLDPIGIIREPDDEQLVPLTGEMRYLSWDEGMWLFNMSSEQRIEMVESEMATLASSRAGMD